MMNRVEGASRARTPLLARPEQLEPPHRKTPGGALRSDARSAALGGGGEERTGAQARAVGSGPGGTQALSPATRSLLALTCVLSLEHLAS